MKVRKLRRHRLTRMAATNDLRWFIKRRRAAWEAAWRRQVEAFVKVPGAEIEPTTKRITLFRARSVGKTIAPTIEQILLVMKQQQQNGNTARNFTAQPDPQP